MNSRLYECTLMHARFSPKAHRFVYRIFLLAIDLDELDALHRRLRLFSVNRANLYAFRERDYLPTGDPITPSLAPTAPPVHENCHSLRDTSAPFPSITPLRTPRVRPSLPSSPSRDTLRHPSSTAPSLKARVLAHLATRDIDLTRGRVVLVTLPRMLGYLFNPVSFYFCYDRAGALAATLVEVTNTFHEVKPYTLGPDCAADNGSFRLRVPKHFYVSPFSDVDVAFDFNLRPLTDRLSVQIDDYVGAERTLTTTLAGAQRPLTDAALAWYLFKYPLLTLRVITLIHWHALRLWLKRVPWFAKAARPADQRDLYRPHLSPAPVSTPHS